MRRLVLIARLLAPDWNRTLGRVEGHDGPGETTSSASAVLCLVATFVTLTLLRMPIAYAMFSGSIVYPWVAAEQHVGLVVDGTTMNTLSGLYVLLAVPMFILARQRDDATTSAIAFGRRQTDWLDAAWRRRARDRDRQHHLFWTSAGAP